MEAPSTSTTDLQDAKTGPCTIDGTTTSTSRTLLVGEVQCKETHANAGKVYTLGIYKTISTDGAQRKLDIR